MHQLLCPVRDYAWGSREFLANLQGRPSPTAGPEAEMWIGAHPSSPSTLTDRQTLGDLITANPVAALGSDAVTRHGPNLPFLLKILAAAQPLSLQAHPNLTQAKAGYLAERAKPAGARSYVDANHKPELLVALTPFEALCGFRPPDDAAHDLAVLHHPELAPVVRRLRQGDIHAALRLLLTYTEPRRASLVAAVTTASANLPGPAHRMITNLAAAHPTDMGVIVSVLLNHINLQPGQALWIPAGNLHAYLHGSGIELMAASDNVLRGGLTTKRVDIPELLAILEWAPLDDPILPARQLADGVTTWPVPINDFALHRVQVNHAPVVLDLPGPRLIVCVEGTVTVGDADGQVTLAAAGAAYSPTAGGRLAFTGQGATFVASL